MRGHITDPKAEGGLDLREVPEPSPAPSDVVVEVRAYAMNRGEMNLLQQRPDGWQPGQDVGGVISQAAADGSGPAVGTRVVGIADQGGWSQRVTVPSHRVAAIPESVSFEEAAALPVAGLTALRALGTGGPLLGRRVLVTGASGGVGSFGVQLAKLAGARVTAQVSGLHRVEAARALDADNVVTTLEGVSERFDFVLDGVGGQVLTEAIRHLAPGGTIAAYGMASGERTEMAFGDFREAPGGKLTGFFVYGTDVSTFGRDLGFLANLVASGQLAVPIGAHHDWTETRQAIKAFREHETTGKIILSVGAA